MSRRAKCSTCGDRNPITARCTYAEPSPICNAPGGEHVHIVCSQCGAQRVDLPNGRALAVFASAN